MDSKSIRKLLLSNLDEDNKVGIEIILGKSRDLQDFKYKLWWVIGYDGLYLRLGNPIHFATKTAEILLNHSITNTK